MNMTGFGCLRLGVLVAIALPGSASPLRAEDRPEHYVLATFEGRPWWKAQSRVLVDWRTDKPVMAGLECVTSYVRTLRDGQPPMEISVSHPVESAAYDFRFHFNLGEAGLTDRKVETITVGGRPYQRQGVGSRVVPWFGVHGPNDVILSYGIARDMFRPNEAYPWLPVEFLIPQFFEVDGITLGISGNFEVSHGNYEKRYEDLRIDMSGFKEAFSWCIRQVNASGDRKVELPAELKKRIDERPAR